MDVEHEMSGVYQDSLLKDPFYVLSNINISKIEYRPSFTKKVSKYLLFPLYKIEKKFKAGFYLVDSNERFCDIKINELLEKEVYYSKSRQNFIFKPVVRVHLNDGTVLPHICENMGVAQKLFNHFNSLYNSKEYKDDVIDQQSISGYINKIPNFSRTIISQSEIDSLKYKSDIIEC